MIIPSFQGNQFQPGTANYDNANNIYAYTTFGKERNMNPGAILQPTSIEDICGVVKWAAAQSPPVPIAIRTGGHQYSGASSTGPTGIQLDLQPTFRRPRLDLELVHEGEKAFIKSSVSWMLTEFWNFMRLNEVFLPTGQCSTVSLGGHVQTGGYGMLARSFGLLGDYIVEMDIVDHTGSPRKVTKEKEPDLFFALLGGSPGNLGVLTHFKVEVMQDKNFMGSKGLWIAWRYAKQTLTELLSILAKKAEDANLPRGYDFGINIVDRLFNLYEYWPGSPDSLKDKVPAEWHAESEKDRDYSKLKIPLIVVYAQYVQFPGATYDDSFFSALKAVKHPLPVIKPLKKESPPGAGMSTIASMWLFAGQREFPFPYVKRTNASNSTSLTADKWPEWFAGRVHEIIGDRNNGLWISSQIQVMGGEQSQYRRNAGNGTAYTWRQATVGGTWDCFFSEPNGSRQAAEKWQAKNDEGLKQCYSKEELGWLWGSYGDWDMKKPEVWLRYYDEATYKRVQQVRAKEDPKGIFTASPFAVERAAVQGGYSNGSQNGGQNGYTNGNANGH